MAKFSILGQPTPYVEFETHSNDVVACEAGSMIYKTPNIQMNTHSQGGVMGALKRKVTGDSLFMNNYTSYGEGIIAIASKYIGSIVHLGLTPGKEYIIQKDGFLCALGEVHVDLYLQRNILAGLFGGEGFAMQKIYGQGEAFIELGGHVTEFYLEAGQEIEVQTGNLGIYESTCQMEIVQVPGVMNKLLGGEGIYNTIIKGPGNVWIQSHSPMVIASNIAELMKQYDNNKETSNTKWI